MRNLAFALFVPLLMACGGDGPSGVPDLDARGTYVLTELSFDPQGLLPSVDLRARITGTLPRLVLATGGQAQLVYEDPATGLITTVDATYQPTRAGEVRITFPTSTSLQAGIFLSRTMTFSFDETNRALTFEGTSPDGVSRQQLIALVPEWTAEQLFDPVPGTLRVIYRVNPPS